MSRSCLLRIETGLLLLLLPFIINSCQIFLIWFLILHYILLLLLLGLLLYLFLAVLVLFQFLPLFKLLHNILFVCVNNNLLTKARSDDRCGLLSHIASIHVYDLVWLDELKAAKDGVRISLCSLVVSLYLVYLYCKLWDLLLLDVAHLKVIQRYKKYFLLNMLCSVHKWTTNRFEHQRVN